MATYSLDLLRGTQVLITPWQGRGRPEKIGTRNAVENAVQEAREKDEYVDGCLAGGPVRVLRYILLFRLENFHELTLTF